jgi:hypothetical protein
MAYDPDLQLARLARQGARLLFYPSCGANWRTEPIFDLDYDVFVLSDYGPSDRDSRHAWWQEFHRHTPGLSLVAATVRTRVFRARRKWGFLFFQDNNEVRERIGASGNKIACFLAVNDGCAEGGNYECVNDPAFLKKTLSLSAPGGMLYLTDHSEALFGGWGKPQPPFPPPPKELILWQWHLTRAGYEVERCDPPRFMKTHGVYVEEPSGRGSWWWDQPSTYGFRPSWEQLAAYQVRPHQPTVLEWTGPEVRVTLEHDSIAHHLGELDGAVVSAHCQRFCQIVEPALSRTAQFDLAPREYFTPGILPKRDPDGAPIRRLLEICGQRRWRTVGTTAFGQGSHSWLIPMLSAHGGGFPAWIRIFHIHAQDFSDIRDQFHPIKETYA